MDHWQRPGHCGLTWEKGEEWSKWEVKIKQTKKKLIEVRERGMERRWQRDQYIISCIYCNEISPLILSLIHLRCLIQIHLFNLIHILAESIQICPKPSELCVLRSKGTLMDSALLHLRTQFDVKHNVLYISCSTSHWWQNYSWWNNLLLKSSLNVIGANVINETS